MEEKVYNAQLKVTSTQFSNCLCFSYTRLFKVYIKIFQ